MTKVIIPLFIALFLGACSSEDPTQENKFEPVVHTLYTDSAELFVEYQPFVVGETSKFAAHFTVLGDNFTALTDAKITVSLMVGDKGIRSSIDSCSSPGIFRLALEPKVAGKGTLMFEVVTKTFTEKFIIKNVEIFPDLKTAKEKYMPVEGKGDITYLKEQAWKVEFANAPVKRQAFSDVIKTSGQLLSAPGDEMAVVAKASGIVLFTNTTFYEGSAVRNGQSLFTVSGADLNEVNVDANYKDAKLAYSKAKADFDRATDLVKDKLITNKEYLQIKQSFESAENQLNTFSRNYSAKGKSSTAPMDGYVKNIVVKEGQFVEAGQTIATVSKNKRLILQAIVSQTYFNQLASVTSANFTAGPNSKVIYSTLNMNGSAPTFGKSTVQNAPFIPITFEIDNTGTVVPGSVVEVYLKSIPLENVLVIPVSSLVEEQGFFYVFVQMGGESFEKREVKLGVNDGLNVQVLKGIEEGERVVTKGAYQIKLSTASGALPAHGHEH
jgi:cobalt-zinc-cadmium efflux system membrane fusion protein